MAISGASGVRHVRCPKCHSVLEEPSDVPVYQCGGCGASLRAKISTGDGGDTREAPPVSAPSSGSGRLHPRSQSRHLGGAVDVASTSAPAPDAPSTRHRGPDMTSRSDTGDLMSARPPVVEKKGHDRQSTTTNQDEVGVSSEHRSRRGSDAPNVGVSFSRGSRDGAEPRDSEKRREPEPEADAARKNDSGEAAARPRRHRGIDEAAATPSAARTMDTQSTGDVLKLSPLHEKILKTVDELKGDLSELFSKSPEVEPRTPARSPRLLPRRDSHVSRPPPVPISRARHADAAAVGHYRGSKAGYVGSKHGQAAPRGLPSRRYRRCRADPCARPGPCRYGCCDHGKLPECSSCRSHCCGSRAQEPARRQRPPAAREAKRRAPPRYHCRPVLKGAPFIVCSSCFTLVQVPAGFAVSNMKVSKLRCGSCSAVLSYSYRDTDGKKLPPQSLDQYSTDGSEAQRDEGCGGAGAQPDLFSFIEDFAHGASCSYSTEDEQPLHVSRNSSLSTVVGDETTAPAPQSTALHRLMGYGSASELLLLRRSPSLYESFDKRSTTSPPPDARRRYHDSKGKGVYVDDADDDDSDDDSRGALKRSNVRGAAGWTHSKGVPAPGAIRIRS